MTLSWVSCTNSIAYLCTHPAPWLLHVLFEDSEYHAFIWIVVVLYIKAGGIVCSPVHGCSAGGIDWHWYELAVPSIVYLRTCPTQWFLLVLLDFFPMFDSFYDLFDFVDILVGEKVCSPIDAGMWC